MVSLKARQAPEEFTSGNSTSHGIASLATRSGRNDVKKGGSSFKSGDLNKLIWLLGYDFRFRAVEKDYRLFCIEVPRHINEAVYRSWVLENSKRPFLRFLVLWVVPGQVGVAVELLERSTREVGQ